MIKKEIIYFGNKTILACDGRCKKAWGINNRPREQLNEDNIDDYCFLSDDELGVAPEDPGIYEGGYAKPKNEEERLNKWCARECERSYLGCIDQPIELPDFSKRLYNIS